MKKEEINNILREFVKNHVSPTPEQRSFVSKVYKEICAILGVHNCLMIGSYPRFTAINPPHDLDIIYTIGDWTGVVPNPSWALTELKSRFEKEFNNPTEYDIVILLQSHSITLSFRKSGIETFAVDIVPALRFGVNEFGDSKYMVPEILRIRHEKRRQKYEELSKALKQMDWIPSDPRGYIKIAQLINEKNEDFRKTVKFNKHWKSKCKRQNENFKLKSFHLEQILTDYFRNDFTLEILDATKRFLIELPKFLERAQIPDRADPGKFIDEYVNELTTEEKANILRARETFLKNLESFDENSVVSDLWTAGSLFVAAGASNASSGSSTSPIIRSVTPKPVFGGEWE
jgi:hypothetical protein